MNIAAIYARFSSDKQNETSIQDQEDQGLKLIQDNNWQFYQTYSDDGVSASIPMADREGGKEMLSDAFSNKFNILIIESLDRTFRDLPDQETVIRNLEFIGIRIIGIADRYDSENSSRKIQRIFAGLKNEDYLDDLRFKTHRGLTGQFNRGFHTGGKPYGYKNVSIGEEGNQLQIDQEQAEIVQWIFQQFANGKSPRAIAIELNNRGIPSPRGSTWSLSAIYGQRNKTCGILANETYIGKFTWNRSKWVKIPGTGKRKRIERPESEWHRRDMPELRIISDELWHQVQYRREKSYQTYTNNKRPGKTLLAGLLKCGHCGGSVIAVDKRCYGCGQHKDRGTCKPSIRIPRETMEQQILGFVKDELLSSTTAKDIQKRIRAKIKARKKQKSNIGTLITKKQKEIDNLINAIVKAGTSESLNNRLKQAEIELSELKTLSEQEKAKEMPDIIPAIPKRFQQITDNLQAYLKRDTTRARELLHELLGEVVILEKENTIFAEVHINQIRLLQSNSASRAGSGGRI